MSEIKREEKKPSDFRFTKEELDRFFVHEEEQYSGCYERSGWRLYKIDKLYYITYFSHCSCYDTWEEITISECISGKDDYRPSYKYRLAYLWKGDAKQTLEFARNRLDPHIHDREISSRDSGFESLYKMYKWIESNVKMPVEPKPKPRPELEDTGVVSNEFIAAAAKWSAQAMATLGFVPAEPSGNPAIATIRVVGSGIPTPSTKTSG